MLTSLTKKIKVDFFTRLSHIIIIQICFIFAAVALVVFSQQEQKINNNEYLTLKKKFSELGEHLEPILYASLSNQSYDESLGDIKKGYSHIFDLNNIAQSYLYYRDSSGNPVNIFTLKQYSEQDDNPRDETHLKNLVDTKIIFSEMDRFHDNLIQVIPNTKYVIYYYHFIINNQYPVVLATIIEHEYMVVQRPQLMYTFILLFLASLFITLLIVYLIDMRFKEPLKRIMLALEKTTQGDMYFMVETGEDNELNELSKAFNKMSSTLYSNEKQLKQSYKQLKKSNIQLKESQEYLKLIVENSPASIISTDPNGKVEIFNNQAAQEFLWNPNDITGNHINTLFTHTIEEYHSQMAEGENEGLEILCKRKDNSYFPAYMIETPIRNQQREITAILFIILDISESKNFKEMMIRLDRYYTRGQMAGDIAHEINNFLTILSGNIELIPMLLQQDNPEKLKQRISLMRTTIDRIAKFTDGLMDTGETDTRFEKTDINQLIETVLTFLKPQNKFDNIAINTDLSTQIPLVEIDPGQFQQLLVNLIYNAGDVLADWSGDKKISIETKMLTHNQEQQLLMLVTDSGPGIAEEKAEKMFVDRFTTKQKGHGIGLITCKNIVDKHSGSIAYSTRGGACFTVTLPLQQPIEQHHSLNKTTRIKIPVQQL